MARSYPDTPAGRSRELRDIAQAAMKRNGHQVSWRRWRKGTVQGGGNWLSAPGWEGACARCWDTVHVVSLEGNVAYRAVTDVNGAPCSFRQCRKRRRR